MFLKKLVGLGGKSFLGDEIDELGKEVIQRRFVQAALIVSAVSFPATAAFVPNQPKGWKLAQLGMGTLLGVASAYVSKIREEGELRFESHLKLNREVYKSEVKNRYGKDQIIGEVVRDSSVKSALIKNIDKITLQGVFAYAEKYGIPQAIFTDLLPPPPASDEEEYTSTERELKTLGIAKPNQDILDICVNKTAAAVFKQLSARYPEYVRLDGKWVLELIKASSEHNMKKRSNHHFMISAETQSGKSTLAGVLARGIAERSQQPAVIAGHDAKKIPGKKDITRWLCDFTDGYKIDGYANTEKWSDLLHSLMAEQFDKASEAGGAMDGLREIVFIQDEMNTIYGEGKGYGKIVTPEMAKSLQGEWLYLITQLAGMRGHGIFMGQSPLSGETGISRPQLKNLCFIAMGQTSSYILENPKNFLNHVSDEVLQVLKQACEMFEKEGLRYALIRPTRGNAYVAIIPEFDVEGILNGTVDIEVIRDDEEEVTYETQEKTPKTDHSEAIPATVAPWQIQKETEAGGVSKPPVEIIFEKMQKWVEMCYMQYGRYPQPQHIRQVWESESGQTLSEAGLKHLLERLRLV